MIARRDIGSLPSSPQRVTREHRGSPRHVSWGMLLCVNPQSLCEVELDQAGAGDSRWVQSRPVQCVVGTVGWPRRHRNGVGVHDDWGWSDPGTLLGVPSLPLSEGHPPLAVSGSSRGWPACVSSSHTREARMWSAIAGAQGTTAAVPGPHGGRGHTCRTPPRACSP